MVLGFPLLFNGKSVNLFLAFSIAFSIVKKQVVKKETLLFEYNKSHNTDKDDKSDIYTNITDIPQ